MVTLSPRRFLIQVLVVMSFSVAVQADEFDIQQSRSRLILT